MPLCSSCGEDLDAGNFSKKQLSKKSARRCKTCVESPLPRLASDSAAIEMQSGTCIEIKPAPFGTARAAIVLNVAPEPLPVTGGGRVEEQEKRILMRSRGWRQPHGLKGYSVDADYPDLYGYFDAEDTSSPRNEVAESIFSAYPCDGPGGRLPRHGIRGPVLVLRMEPPGVVTPQGRSQHVAQWDENIALDELRDTIEMYEMQPARVVARQRDMTRTMGGAGGMGAGAPPPEMLAMLQTMMGGMYVGPTGAQPFDFGA